MLSSGNIVSPITYSTLYEVYPTPGSPLREILLIVSSCCNFPLSIVVFYKKFDFGLDPQIPGAKRGSCLACGRSEARSALIRVIRKSVVTFFTFLYFFLIFRLFKGKKGKKR